jgi:hypothetical protein
MGDNAMKQIYVATIFALFLLLPAQHPSISAGIGALLPDFTPEEKAERAAQRGLAPGEGCQARGRTLTNSEEGLLIGMGSGGRLFGGVAATLEAMNWMVKQFYWRCYQTECVNWVGMIEPSMIRDNEELNQVIKIMTQSQTYEVHCFKRSIDCESPYNRCSEPDCITPWRGM